MRQAGLAVVNLECAITRGIMHWGGAPKACYFGAPPDAALSLVRAGVRLVSLANNHVLDCDVAGLRDTVAAVEMGWKTVFGLSAHVFQGIELHHGRPILYAASDLVDDYLVDPSFRNDHPLLFELEFGGGELRRIQLHPLFIARCRAGALDRAPDGRPVPRTGHAARHRRPAVAITPG